MAFLIGVACGGPYGGSAVYDLPGPVLQAVEDVLWHVLVWSGLAAGTAVAAVTAVGLAALLPGAQRPRLSWWVPSAGACASMVFLPDSLPALQHWLVALQPAWREPVLLVAAGSLTASFVSRHAITRNHAG